MAHSHLTVRLIGRETIRLLVAQMRDYDPALQCSLRMPLERDHLRTLSLDDFSERYLCEAADTMANMAEPSDHVSGIALEIPHGTDAARDSFRGVTLRTILAYDIWHDRSFFQFDLRYSPPIADAEAA